MGPGLCNNSGSNLWVAESIIASGVVSDRPRILPTLLAGNLEGKGLQGEV